MVKEPRSTGDRGLPAHHGTLRGLGVGAVALALTVALVLPAAATPGSSSHSAVGARLARVFAAARHLPVSAVGRIRSGSLHTTSMSGATWAIASFLPSQRSPAQLRVQFQDGAGTGVFTRRGSSPWRLVATGPYGCGRGLPARVARTWGLGRAAACRTGAATQRKAAARALSTPRRTSGATPTSLGQRIATIALGQIGTGDSPTSTSFDLDCNPFSSLVAGFSANANGCGLNKPLRVRNENEEWCADFVKWVWSRAGVTADLDTLNAGSSSFYQWALDQGESPVADSGVPRVGDAVIFYPPGKITPATYSAHVGTVTAVHPDGTIDMANGDFRGKSNIRVEYDTNIDLTDFAAQIYGPGEQWVIVTPKPAPHPAPSVRMTRPGTTVSSTPTSFTAHATEPHGSITRYYWTFGDGRSANTLGAHVSHVFAGTGVYPVSVTVTSSLGTSHTLVRNIDVIGASGTLASSPSTAVWFSSVPVDQYHFVRSASGRLAVDVWDGASWLQETAAGHVAKHGGITALSYPDPAADDATTPHAYFRAKTGGLADTYLGRSGWVTRQLPGRPARGSAIVAATRPHGGVAVFYVTAYDELAETTGAGTSWKSAKLPGPRVAHPQSLALADTSGGPVVFYNARHGLQVVTTARGHPRTRPIRANPARGTALAAVTTGKGDARVFFVKRGGRLAMATRGSPGRGPHTHVRRLPGRAMKASLAASNYLLASDAGPVVNDLPTASPTARTGEEVFSLETGGHPALDYTPGTSSTWHAAPLPGTATRILGANAYQVAGQPSRLFLTGSSGSTEDSAASPSASWRPTVLPSKPATFADRIVLYGATPADRQAATAAAHEAGLPASQVTGSYDVAWAATLSGSHMVVSVGSAALNALYYNACGWSNPSDDPVATPFYIAAAPLDHLPGAEAFENGAAATASQTQQRATDLAYYAVHGNYPAGVTSPPTAASPRRTCSGTSA